MAKKIAPSKSRAAQNSDSIAQCLKRASLMLSRDGWNPDDQARSICGSLTRASRELWPNDEATRLTVLAFSLAEVGARMKRRYPHESIEAWEREMYREPEDVVAIVASPVWPWATMDATTPQETTIEAFMVLQRLNTKSMTIAELQARAAEAFPREWLPDAVTLADIASGVDARTDPARNDYGA